MILTPERHISCSFAGPLAYLGAQGSQCNHLFGGESDNTLPPVTGHASLCLILSPGARSAVQKALHNVQNAGNNTKGFKRRSHYRVCVRAYGVRAVHFSGSLTMMIPGVHI